MRLFRQSRWNNWRDVFEQMAGQLKPLVAAARDITLPPGG